MRDADVIPEAAAGIVAGCGVIGTSACVIAIAVAVDAVLGSYNGSVFDCENVGTSLPVGWHLLPVQGVAQDADVGRNQATPAIACSTAK